MRTQEQVVEIHGFEISKKTIQQTGGYNSPVYDILEKLEQNKTVLFSLFTGADMLIDDLESIGCYVFKDKFWCGVFIDGYDVLEIDD